MRTALPFPHRQTVCLEWKQTSLNMHNTWHMAPDSIHRHKAHPEQSAHNTGQRNNPKKDEATQQILFQEDMSTHFSSTYYIVFVCNLHPPSVPFLVSQHCALIRCPLWRAECCIGVVWDTLKAQTLYSKSSPPPLCSMCRYLRKQTHVRSQMMLDADSRNSPCSR